MSLAVDIAPHRIQLPCSNKSSVRRAFLIKVFASGYHRNDGQYKDYAKILDTVTSSIRTNLAIPLLKKTEDTWKSYS